MLNKMTFFKDRLSKRQDPCYLHFTDEKTKAQNLTPNPGLLQGQKDQRNLTTFSINSLAFIENFPTYGQKDSQPLAAETWEIIRRYWYKGESTNAL